MAVSWLVFWVGRLIQAVSGSARIFGDTTVQKRCGCWARLRSAPCAGRRLVVGQTEVHIGGCVQTDAAVTMLVVVPLGEQVHEISCLQIDRKRSGNVGSYFNVLNSDSEYGLSLDTRGRECPG